MLSPAQLDARRGKITASRIACLMTGDAPEILQLYQEMIGEAVEEDLSHCWPARLGGATEKLNLDWFEEKNSCTITRRGEVVEHPLYPWAACTLDGWINVPPCPIEAKHVGGREPMEIIVDRYQPQMQWIMEVTGAEQIAFSVIMGSNEPVVEYINLDPEYVEEAVHRGQRFIDCVRARIPPVVLPAAPPPRDCSKVYDMTGNNLWANSASSWIEVHPFVDTCRVHEKILKALVPGDAKLVSGHGVRISRDRAGRLSLREDK